MSNWKPAVIAAIVVGVIGVVAGILIGGDDGETTTTVAQPADTTATTTPTDETTTSSEETTPTDETTPSSEETTPTGEAATSTEETTPTEEGATYLFDERRSERLTFGENLTDFGEPVFRAVTIGGQAYEKGIEIIVPPVGYGNTGQFIAVPLEPGDERFTTAFGVEQNPNTRVNIEARADDPLGERLGEKVLVDGSEAPAGILDVDIPPDVETLYLMIRKQPRSNDIDADPVVLGDPLLTAAE